MSMLTGSMIIFVIPSLTIDQQQTFSIKQALCLIKLCKRHLLVVVSDVIYDLTCHITVVISKTQYYKVRC